MTELRLSLLKCLNCGEGLPPGESRIFFFCPQCHSGMHLSGGKLESVRTDFHELTAEATGTDKALPFWAFDVEIRISYRDATGTAGSFFKALAATIREDPTEEFLRSGGRITFFVPAFSLDLEKAKNLGKQMTLGKPSLTAAQTQSFEPIALTCEDAKALGEYIFLSSEIELPDTARSLSYTFNAENPVMKIIRFRKNT
ncbi:MAG: hypothetical protein V2A78_04665 [bacterium]